MAHGDTRTRLSTPPSRSSMTIEGPVDRSTSRQLERPMIMRLARVPRVHGRYWLHAPAGAPIAPDRPPPSSYVEKEFMGPVGFEPTTSRLSAGCSSQTKLWARPA
jgi:hypothetical protein